MDVSPQTLREVEFREKLRGYNQDDVDEFLERVAAGVEILQDRLRQATDRALRAEQRASETSEADEAVRKTLVLAQRTADLAVQEAKDQAAALVEAARTEAKRIEAEAHAQARRVAQEAQARLRADLAALEVARSRLRTDVGALERHVEEQRARVRDAMREALRRLDSQVPPVAPAPPEARVDVPPPPAEDDSDGSDQPGGPALADERPAPGPMAATAVDQDDDIDGGDNREGEHGELDEEGDVGGSGEEPSASADPYAEYEGDEAFMAELRLAATDTTPLGPRDDDGS